MDLIGLQFDRPFVLDALSRGEIDYLENVSEAAEADFFRHLIRRDVRTHPQAARLPELSRLPAPAALGRPHRRPGAGTGRPQNHPPGNPRCHAFLSRLQPQERLRPPDSLRPGLPAQVRPRHQGRPAARLVQPGTAALLALVAAVRRAQPPGGSQEGGSAGQALPATPLLQAGESDSHQPATGLLLYRGGAGGSRPAARGSRRSCRCAPT